MAYQTREEGRNANIAAMGEPLGAQFSELWQEVVYLHRKWLEYLALFGTKPTRVDLITERRPYSFAWSKTSSGKKLYST